MTAAEISQIIGAVGIGLFYPIQNWRAFVTRKPIGLSFVAFSALAVGIGGYLALGIRLGTPIFWVSNASNLVFDTLILTLVWFWSPMLTKGERKAGLFILGVGAVALLFANTMFADKAVAICGWIGLVGIVTFYPIQNAQLFAKRDPTGLSFGAFASLFVGLCALTTFGVLVGNATISLGNGITALGTIPILWAIVHWKKT